MSKNFRDSVAPTPLDGDVAASRNMVFPTYVTMPHSVEVKPFEHNYGDLPENFDPSRPAFQLGH